MRLHLGFLDGLYFWLTGLSSKRIRMKGHCQRTDLDSDFVHMYMHDCVRLLSFFSLDFTYVVCLLIALTDFFKFGLLNLPSPLRPLVFFHLVRVVIHPSPLDEPIMDIDQPPFVEDVHFRDERGRQSDLFPALLALSVWRLFPVRFVVLIELFLCTSEFECRGESDTHVTPFVEQWRTACAARGFARERSGRVGKGVDFAVGAGRQLFVNRETDRVTHLKKPSHSGDESRRTAFFSKMAACWNGAPACQYGLG